MLCGLRRQKREEGNRGGKSGQPSAQRRGGRRLLTTGNQPVPIPVPLSRREEIAEAIKCGGTRIVQQWNSPLYRMQGRL